VTPGGVDSAAVAFPVPVSFRATLVYNG